MDKRKMSMFPPVLMVLLLSVPIAFFTQYDDFRMAREDAEDTVENTGPFVGFTEDRANTISIIPEKVVEKTIPDYKENVTVTNSTGGTEERTQTTGKGRILESLVNALLMGGIAIIAAFGIFLLFKFRRRLTLKLFFAFALGTCTALSLFLYGYFLRIFLDSAFDLAVGEGPIFYILLGALGISAGAAIVYNMVFRSTEPRRKNPALIAFCIILGPFLAIVLPVYVVIFLLIVVALWDLYAAKRGIIKKMIDMSEKDRKEERRKELQYNRSKENGAVPSPGLSVRGTVSEGYDPGEVNSRFSRDQRAGAGNRRVKRPLLSVKQGEDITSYGLYEGKYYSLGIGDFIFFSILVSSTFTWLMLKMPWTDYYRFIYGEILVILLTLIMVGSILLGLKQTLRYLDKEDIMPGLPFSVLWGVVTFLIMAVFLQLVDLVFYGKLFNPF